MVLLAQWRMGRAGRPGIELSLRNVDRVRDRRKFLELPVTLTSA